MRVAVMCLMAFTGLGLLLGVLFWFVISLGLVWPEAGAVIGGLIMLVTEVDEATNPLGHLGGYVERGSWLYGAHGEVGETGYFPFNLGIKIAHAHWFGLNYLGMALIRLGLIVLGFFLLMGLGSISEALQAWVKKHPKEQTPGTRNSPKYPY